MTDYIVGGVLLLAAAVIWLWLVWDFIKMIARLCRERYEDEAMDIDAAFQLADRLAHLSRRPVPCPSCGEALQVQVMNYRDVPAQWRCRRCKFRFDFEPDGERAGG